MRPNCPHAAAVRLPSWLLKKDGNKMNAETEMRFESMDQEIARLESERDDAENRLAELRNTVALFATKLESWGFTASAAELRKDVDDI